jgi:catechol 2,3-dioxygenase-like lactoylglutathione lyase family enzyme
MLQQYQVQATMPAKDFERAKKFYSDQLGMEPSEENPGGVFYNCSGNSRLFLFPSPSGPGGHTQASFTVDNLEKVVEELKSRGVTFEEYDFPALKTENSIAKVGPGHAAWFKDSEGNMIGLVQFD